MVLLTREEEVTQQSREKILARIQKLLQLAADQQGAHEGALAAQTARRLMWTYAVEEDDLLSPDDMTSLKFSLPQRAIWARTLLDSLAYYTSCKLTWVIGTKLVTLWGVRRDVILCQDLFHRLYEYFDDHSREYTSGVVDEWRGVVSSADLRGLSRRVRRGWLLSATQGVTVRVLQLMEQEDDGGDQYALVLSRKSAAENYMRDNILNLKVTKVDSAPNIFIQEGYQTGLDANLNPSLTTEKTSNLRQLERD